MSEIKGQILGMLLVLMVFGAVGGIIYASFQSNANNLSSKFESEITFGKAKEAYKPVFPTFY